jgi:hypothetical protein
MAQRGRQGTQSSAKEQPMSKYLVIGLNDGGRFAETFTAEDPDHAEQEALHVYPELIIAGIINEEGQVVA